jgi:hypothetical protein
MPNSWDRSRLTDLENPSFQEAISLPLLFRVGNTEREKTDVVNLNFRQQKNRLQFV